jgi:KaiC/GvpD/RAD55 family RecA-like ATPase
MNKEYNVELQKLYLEMLVSNPEAFVRVQNIFNPQNFDRSLRPIATFVLNYVDEYKALPEVKQINSKTGSKLEDIVVDQLEEHSNWLLDEFEQFSRHKELERAILDSADLLENGDYGLVEAKIKEAVQVGLTKDMGTDYWDNPRERLMNLKTSNGQVSTGWEMFDRKLFGGFNRGELQIFAGGSGSGKSLFMQNLAVNWVLAGLNVLYFTLELSEELTAMRIDSMISNISTKEIFKDLDTVEMKIKLVSKKAGELQIKYMPAQSNINDFRSYIKELNVQKGMKADVVLVDYLDLCMPISTKVAPSDLYVKDKYVAEELRNLSKELDVVFVTASQLNRSAVDEIEFDHSHIAGGISKINTADNVIGIFTSRAMRERGRYQVQFMKTRSSSGVGSKVDLEFDISSLRIRDLGEDAQSEEDTSYTATQTQSTNIFDRINRSATVQPNEDTPKVTAEASGSKIRSLLRNMNTPDEI